MVTIVDHVAAEIRNSTQFLATYVGTDIERTKNNMANGIVTMIHNLASLRTDQATILNQSIDVSVFTGDQKALMATAIERKLGDVRLTCKPSAQVFANPVSSQDLYLASDWVLFNDPSVSLSQKNRRRRGPVEVRWLSLPGSVVKVRRCDHLGRGALLHWLHTEGHV